MDLDIKRVLAARPGEPEEVELTPLVTPWGERVSRDCPLPEYPRPQCVRDDWTCLNGPWEYQIQEGSSASELWSHARPPKTWAGTILVPFSPEAPLSGVGRQLMPTQLLWYRRTFELDHELGHNLLMLHFGAVDYACACYVNGARVAAHVGGYHPLDVDVSDVVEKGENVIELCVWDPSDHGTQLRGKQRIRRGNMWYTAQSGIWQTVWMEELPARCICDLALDARPDERILEVRASVSEEGEILAADVFDDSGKIVASSHVVANEKDVLFGIRVGDVHLWDVDDPYLYTVRLSYGRDSVQSYCAFRTVGVEPDDEGVWRFCLNHRPLFVRGLLDQGYWPDGLMTAPSDEALLADIEVARAAGFNMLRKHIKVESDRWYWHCDRLGMLVWQDMVSGGENPREWESANIPTLVRRSWSVFGDTRPRHWRLLGSSDEAYRREWQQTAEQTIRRLSGHPCIASWVVFNESWGQFLSEEMTERLREVDATRPFESVSGWYDQGAGEFFAVHNYFRSMRVYRDPHALPGKRSKRAFVIDEFGGLTCPIEGHTSVPTVYGYDTYEDAGSWKAALLDLLAQVDALEQEGLSGFVYTQLSDVEEETNGLVTYDRRVNKLEAE